MWPIPEGFVKRKWAPTLSGGGTPQNSTSSLHIRVEHVSLCDQTEMEMKDENKIAATLETTKTIGTEKEEREAFKVPKNEIRQLRRINDVGICDIGEKHALDREGFVQQMVNVVFANRPHDKQRIQDDKHAERSKFGTSGVKDMVLFCIDAIKYGEYDLFSALRCSLRRGAISWWKKRAKKVWEWIHI